MPIRLSLVALPLLLATGCGDPQVKLHHPGDYSGSPDPLMQVSGTTELDNQLRDRMMMVQTDR